MAGLSGAGVPEARRRPRAVLVTGASRGIGGALAARLLAEGTHVALAGRDRKALEGVRDGRSHASVLVADLAASGGGAALAERAIQALGQVDGLVHCAGAIDYQAVGEVGEAQLRGQLEVDFVQPFLLCQALASHMRHAGGGGAMVLVGSTLAERPAPRTAAYAAAKAALTAMGRAFALELAPAGIRVNVVAPGVVDTAMVRVPRGPLAPGEDAGQRVERQLEALRGLHPLGRLGQPEDVVECILLALEATWMTGALITPDGGLSLGAAGI
jgi:3-oxoacyl-[acyl-carrier protein] reductase